MNNGPNRYARVTVAAKEARRLNGMRLANREVNQPDFDAEILVPIPMPTEPEEKVTVMALRRIREGKVEFHYPEQVAGD
jgi:DNA-directed RNA polymerase omega subunit